MSYSCAMVLAWDRDFRRGWLTCHRVLTDEEPVEYPEAWKPKEARAREAEIEQQTPTEAWVAWLTDDEYTRLRSRVRRSRPAF